VISAFKCYFHVFKFIYVIDKNINKNMGTPHPQFRRLSGNLMTRTEDRGQEKKESIKSKIRRKEEGRNVKLSLPPTPSLSVCKGELLLNA
jgi:hypothetical protein